MSNKSLPYHTISYYIDWVASLGGNSRRKVIRIPPNFDCDVHCCLFKMSLCMMDNPLAKYLC